MEIVFLAILIIGVLSSCFGLLMIFAPNFILKVERSANQLYMTDAALMNNRIPLGVFMLVASGFLIFSYYTGPYKEIIFLYLSVIAGVFGLFLLIKPNMILIAERKANKLYMTDAFFFKHRIILGITLIAASIFMLRTYFTFGLT
jgi:hypothetical protein|tara:strand:+ start:4158 stop:4592 length:435 start_codon:yes stop_codon:yes gene_type:complete